MTVATRSLFEPTQYLTGEELENRPVRHRRAWTIITAVEVVAAVAVIILDLVVPSLVLLAMAGLGYLLYERGLGRADAAGSPSSIAVMPFCFASLYKENCIANSST